MLFSLLTDHCLLLTVNYSALTAYNVLPTADYSLLTAYYWQVQPRPRQMLFFGYKLSGSGDAGETPRMDNGLTEHTG